jgi:diguanylate cyclase (GGDEF)-like protein
MHKSIVIIALTVAILVAAGIAHTRVATSDRGPGQAIAAVPDPSSDELRLFQRSITPRTSLGGIGWLTRKPCAPITVCLVDVDKFKTINDTYGHDIGDIVLRKIAEVLSTNLRENDVVSRLGGDEFLLVLHGADADIAAMAIERVRATLAREPLRTRNGNVSLTVSAGYAVREPHSGKTAAEFILLADQALISSKAEGRNRVQAAVGA